MYMYVKIIPRAKADTKKTFLHCSHQAEVLADVIAEQEKELKFYQTQISPLLLNCANVVVADEGHVIKNPATEKARALMRIKTKKRVALTGYPLQNRLIEYYTMVDWVQKGLLPEEEDFKLNFVAPITLGEIFWKSDSRQANHEFGVCLVVFLWKRSYSHPLGKSNHKSSLLLHFRSLICCDKFV